MAEPESSSSEGRIGAETVQWLDTYRQFLRMLSNDALDYQHILTQTEEIDFNSFFREAAVSRELWKRTVKRWATGEKPKANPELIKIFQNTLPPTIWVHPEDLLALNFEENTIHAIDEQAIQFIQDLLTASGTSIADIKCNKGRNLDSREFKVNLADKEPVLIGINELLWGAIKTVESINTPALYIQLFRDTGISYRQDRNILAFVSEAALPKKGMKLSIDSGANQAALLWQGEVYELKGNRLHHITDKARKEHYFYIDMTYPDAAVSRPYTAKSKFTRLPESISWSDAQKPFVEELQLLRGKIKQPLHTEGLESEADIEYPAELGPVILYVPHKELIRLYYLQKDSLLGYPEERTGIMPQRAYLKSEDWKHPNYRISDTLSTLGKFGYVNENDDLDKIDFGNWDFRWSNGLEGDPDGMVVIDPLSANGIYVFDAVRRGRDVLDTLISITQYRGQYEKPLIIIQREILPQEITKLVFPPDGEKIQF